MIFEANKEFMENLSSKTAFEKYKPWDLFSEFYGNLDSGEAENENEFFHLSLFLFDLFLCAFYPPENVITCFIFAI